MRKLTAGDKRAIDRQLGKKKLGRPRKTKTDRKREKTVTLRDAYGMGYGMGIAKGLAAAILITKHLLPPTRKMVEGDL